MKVLGMVGVVALMLGAPAMALDDGTVLGPDTWTQARELLPEEILEHYRRGEYRNPILDLDQPGYRSLAMPEDFRKASAANAGRYAVNTEGSIVDTASGQLAGYIFGLPFPEIDPADPHAATKIVWNHFYRTWYNGDGHFLNELVMIGTEGVERSVQTEVKMRMYDGSAQAEDRGNPQNLQMQTLACVVAPADLAGVVSLTWRYRDPDKHDSQWSYVPGLRRVRQVSALNRSDGFMGSDLSLDDGPFFDGKPEDFTFTLLGKRDQLVLVDPYSLRGEAELVPVEGGGWRIVWRDVPRFGAEMPGWAGLPWAPVSAALTTRTTWVVEARPKDPNYLYGRMVFRFDAETYDGSWASKYDWANSLLLSYQVSRGAYFAAGEGERKEHIPAGGVVVRTAENFLFNRATVVTFPPANPKNPADYRVESCPDDFRVDSLLRLGK